MNYAVCYCTGECHRTGTCPAGIQVTQPGPYVWPGPPENEAWQCPGCKQWKAPYVKACDCANEIRWGFGGPT